MIDYDAAIRAIDEYIEKNRRWEAAVLSRTTKIISRHKEPLIQAISNFQREVVEDVFYDAVTNFYDEYDPKRYIRKGNVSSKTGGLYDLLDIKTDNNGFVMLTSGNALGNPNELLNIDALKGHRLGAETLYEQVFVKGWHGGAPDNKRSPKMWGKHPKPGTPLYRRPGRVPGTNAWWRYAKWDTSKKVTISANPPAESITKGIAGMIPFLISGYQKIADDDRDLIVSEIADEVKKINKEIYGVR